MARDMLKIQPAWASALRGESCAERTVNMSRIFVIGLLACLASGGPGRAQSSSGPGPYLHLDPASEQLYQEGNALSGMLTNQMQPATPAAEEAGANYTGNNLWFYL